LQCFNFVFSYSLSEKIVRLKIFCAELADIVIVGNQERKIFLRFFLFLNQVIFILFIHQKLQELSLKEGILSYTGKFSIN